MKGGIKDSFIANDERPRKGAGGLTMAKLWWQWPEECPRCGHEPFVLTVAMPTADFDVMAYDQDPVACIHCGNTGEIVVYEGSCAETEWQWQD